jgi:hypothetical protein
MTFKVLALPILALCTLSVARAQSTTFTLGSNVGCSYHLYTFASRFTCTGIPAVLADGTVTTQGFYFDMQNDGTFGGTYYTDPYTPRSFTGTYQGPQNAVTGMSGAWTGGNITAVFGLHQIGGYRGTKVTVRYLIAGAGAQ